MKRLLSRSILEVGRRKRSALISTSGAVLEEIDNKTEFGCLIKRCSNLKQVEQTHGFMVRTALDCDMILLSQFIEACSSLGFSGYAYSVFAFSSHPNIYLFNTMIKALTTLSNFPLEALLVYKSIASADLQPDSYSFPFALKAVVDLQDLCWGIQIHSQTISTGFDSNVHVATALIQMYSSCYCISDAHKLFEQLNFVSESIYDVAFWNAMISGYVKVGNPDAAWDLLEQMPQTQANADAMIICWTAVIAGYAQSNRPNEAIRVFRIMQLEHVKPDELTMLAVLSACAYLGAIQFQLGECIHGYIHKHGFNQMISLKNALIEMYAKSGDIGKSLQVFDNMKHKTVITWTTIISALAFHGLGKPALQMFSRMERSQVKPNDVTFIAILSACAHVGLVDLGRYYFNTMKSRYGIQPKIQHYGCMIDLLGRAGYLKEARELVSLMPFEANAAIWGSLLSASNIHGDAELGELALQHLVKMEPWSSGNYALLSNIYASIGRWDNSVMTRKMMRDKGVTKMRGWSFIQVSNKAHEFIAGDTSHPQFDRINGIVCNMNEQLKAVHLVNEFISELDFDC